MPTNIDSLVLFGITEQYLKLDCMAVCIYLSLCRGGSKNLGGHDDFF